MRYLPKWISGQDSALEIYDEVVAALPNHELTLRALQSKAELLSSMGEYRECVETYRLIIRRFQRMKLFPRAISILRRPTTSKASMSSRTPTFLLWQSSMCASSKLIFPAMNG